MSEGIKESKELLLSLISLGAFVVNAGKDGYDLADLGSFAAKIFADSKFRELLEAGVKNIDLVPAELKDVSGEEAVELIAAIVDALRSK